MTKKIWLAISHPFQVNFFYELMKRLQKRYQFLITARDVDITLQLLAKKGLNYINVGRHGGKDKAEKLKAYAEAVINLTEFVRQEKLSLLLGECWDAATRTAFGLNIPAWNIFTEERQYWQNWMTLPLSSKIFAPTFYRYKDLQRFGVVDRRKIVWFNGFHTCYLRDWVKPRENPLQKAGIKSPSILIRPEFTYASFFHSERPILEKTVKILAKEIPEVNIVVMPRTEEQKRRYLKLPVTILEDFTQDPPVAYVDIVIGAAETMLSEAFVLGVPAISCIYWKPSKIVQELQKYIPHSTSPRRIVRIAKTYLKDSKRREFAEKAKTIVEKMDNPVSVIAKELSRGSV